MYSGEAKLVCQRYLDTPRRFRHTKAQLHATLHTKSNKKFWSCSPDARLRRGFAVFLSQGGYRLPPRPASNLASPAWYCSKTLSDRCNPCSLACGFFYTLFVTFLQVLANINAPWTAAIAEDARKQQHDTVSGTPESCKHYLRALLHTQETQTANPKRGLALLAGFRIQPRKKQYHQHNVLGIPILLEDNHHDVNEKKIPCVRAYPEMRSFGAIKSGLLIG
ncbi:MAG: hypothetical protein ACK5PS_16690 [Desulfopila sp.]